MDTNGQSSWEKGVPAWLGGSRPAAMDSGFLWFGTALLRGLVILVPVVVMIGAMFATGERPIMLALWIIGLFSFFGYLVALLPAFTGALLYLPLVWWGARRWPRAGRIIALACAPLMGLGTLPFWEMWRMVEMWQMWIPVAAGLLAWAATLPLPPLRADGGTMGGR